jgi:hypothetical protein
MTIIMAKKVVVERNGTKEITMPIDLVDQLSKYEKVL